MDELKKETNILKARLMFECADDLNLSNLPQKELNPDSMLDMSVQSRDAGFMISPTPKCPLPATGTVAQILEERNKEINKLLGQVQQTEIELSRRTIDLNQARTECSALKAEMEKVSKVAKRTEQELEHAKVEIQSQRSVISSEARLRQEVLGLKDEISKVKLQADQRVLQESSRAKETTRLEYATKMSALQDQLNEHTQKLHRLVAEKSTLETQLSRTQDQFNKQAASLSKSEQLNSDLESELKNAQSEIKNLTYKLQSKDQELLSESSKKEFALREAKTLRETLDSDKHFKSIGIDFSDYEQFRAHVAEWSQHLKEYQLQPELDKAHKQIKFSLQATLESVRSEAEKYTASLLFKEQAENKKQLALTTEAIMKMEAVLVHLNEESRAQSLKPSRDMVEDLSKRRDTLDRLASSLKTVKLPSKPKGF